MQSKIELIRSYLFIALGFLIPFSLATTNKLVVPCQYLTAATGDATLGATVEKLHAILSGHVFEALPEDHAVPPFGRPKRPARLTLKIFGDVVDRKSRITQRPYKSKKVDK